MAGTSPERARVLVLTADVGEGHLAAGRALAGLLALEPGVSVGLEDGLRCLGPLPRRLIRDGYRRQLRAAPWTYNAMYVTWRHLAPLRWLGARALHRAGRRGLGRLIREIAPEIVVSTHPALTAALGRMRRRGELDAVLCATVLDLVDNPMWSDRGVDLHLVMDPMVIPWVERTAGRGSAVAVRPLVDPRFRAHVDPRGARARLGLPAEGSVVVVSGGGWGVGALADGADGALDAGADSVIVLAGRNREAGLELRHRYRAQPRVRVLDFTDRMPDLLGAADALVHGTGGATSLEAVACGCPVIGFGTRLAHVREHNEALGTLGLCRVAPDAAALRSELGRLLARPRPAAVSDGRSTGCADGATAVLTAARRVRPISRLRLRFERLSIAIAASATVFWGAATDDAFSLAARPLNLVPARGLRVRVRAEGVVVLAPPADIPGLDRRLAAHAVHVSFGVTNYSLTPAAARAVRIAGDDAVPVLPEPGTVRWIGTDDELDDVHGFVDDRLALALNGSISLGQYLFARSTGHAPLTAFPAFGRGGRLVHGRLRPGEILIVRTSTVGPALRLVASVRAMGLAALPVSRLLSDASSASITATTAEQRASGATDAPATTSRPAARPHARSATPAS